MKKINKFFRTNLLTKKILWTLLFISISILGTKIPLPLTNYYATSNIDSILDITSSSDTRRSIMSLGIAPLISGNIIWQVLVLTKVVNIQKIPKKTADFNKNLLILCISLIQGSIIILSLMGKSKFSEVADWKIFFSLLLFIVAGAFIMVFLSNMNTELGLGKYMIFLLIGIIDSGAGKIKNLFTNDANITNVFIIILVIFSLFLVVFSIFVESTQYRIKINSILSNNEMYDKSYIAIKLNPSSGMAFMFAMTFVVIPQLFVKIMANIFPNVKWLEDVANNMTLSSSTGVAIYLIVLFLLSLGFSFSNVNPQEMSKRLLYSGDYISNIRPGKKTYTYLNNIVYRLGLVGAFYTLIVAGFPLIYGLYNKQIGDIVLLPGSLMIVIGMILSIYDEIQILNLSSKYKDLFD